MTRTHEAHPSEDRMRSALRGAAAGLDLSADMIEAKSMARFAMNGASGRVSVNLTV